MNCVPGDQEEPGRWRTAIEMIHGRGDEVTDYPSLIISCHILILNYTIFYKYIQIFINKKLKITKLEQGRAASESVPDKPGD